MNVLTNSANSNFTRASDVKIPDIYFRRFKTGIESIDDLFGGAGFVPGFMATLAAPAGCGKSSFSLQVLEALEAVGKRTAYISGEENIEQVSFSCKRLNVSSVPLANLVYIEDIEEAVIKHNFEFIVLDSYPTIQTKQKMNSREKEDYIINRLVTLAKEREVCIWIIMHYTKSGTFKGSTALNHAVDCFFTIDKNPDDYNCRNVMVHKNRFGSGSFTTLHFGANGYDFEPVEVDNPIQKTNKKASKRDLVLNVLDTEKTVAQVAQESGVNGSYLTTLMRDLVTQGTVAKCGRGAEATYKKK
jgi:DNA repair protein RadA/Sms